MKGRHYFLIFLAYLALCCVGFAILGLDEPFRTIYLRAIGLFYLCMSPVVALMYLREVVNEKETP